MKPFIAYNCLEGGEEGAGEKNEKYFCKSNTRTCFNKITCYIVTLSQQTSMYK